MLNTVRAMQAFSTEFSLAQFRLTRRYISRSVLVFIALVYNWIMTCSYGHMITWGIISGVPAGGGWLQISRYYEWHILLYSLLLFCYSLVVTDFLLIGEIHAACWSCCSLWKKMSTLHHKIKVSFSWSAGHIGCLRLFPMTDRFSELIKYEGKK